MAYIGASPPATALTASDISDGIISEAKMANDAISLAELKAGTDGELISWDASANPVAVAAGSSGEFLKSQGAGSVPVFAAAGGTWVKILQQTASTSSSLEWKHGTNGVVIDSTYNTYCIVFTDAYASTQHSISVQVSPDTGSSYDTSGYYYMRNTMNYATGSTTITNAGATGQLVQINQHGASLITGGSGRIFIYSPANASSKTMGVSYALELSDGTNNIRHQTAIGVHDTAEAIDAFRILPSTGTINGGVFTLYGIVH